LFEKETFSGRTKYILESIDLITRKSVLTGKSRFTLAISQVARLLSVTIPPHADASSLFDHCEGKVLGAPAYA